jgi:hypothetical protein
MALRDGVFVGPMRPRHDLEMGSTGTVSVLQGSTKMVSAWYYTRSVPGRMQLRYSGFGERMQKTSFA